MTHARLHLFSYYDFEILSEMLFLETRHEESLLDSPFFPRTNSDTRLRLFLDPDSQIVSRDVLLRNI